MEKDSPLAYTFNAPEIFDSFASQANSILGLSGGLGPLHAFDFQNVGGFPYVGTVLNAGAFNAATYDWISGSLAEGCRPYEMSGTRFAQIYCSALQNIEWSLSNADYAALNTAQTNAASSQSALISTWYSAFGPISTGSNPIDKILQIIVSEWASDPTTLEAIQQAPNVHAVLNRIPMMGAQIMPLLINWLNALGSAVSLQSELTQNQIDLINAIDAVQSPSKKNNATLLSNREYAPTFHLTPQVSEIRSTLESSNESVAIKMLVNGTKKGRDPNFTLLGDSQTPINGNLLSLDVGGNADYFSDVIANENAEITVVADFSGVSLVNVMPARAGDENGGWLWLDPIIQAERNHRDDVSGFKWLSNMYPNLLGPDMLLGYASGVAIANAPIISISVRSSDFLTIAETMQNTGFCKVRFLGQEVKNDTNDECSIRVQTDTSSQTTNITLRLPSELGEPTSAGSFAWVMGIQPTYPER